MERTSTKSFQADNLQVGQVKQAEQAGDAMMQEVMQSEPLKKFTTFVQEKFDQIDTDKDGFLSGSELRAGITGNAFNAEEKRMIGILRNTSGFSRLSNDSWGFDISISRKDIDKFCEKVPSYLETRDARQKLVDFIQNNFSRFSSNSMITENDVDKFLKRTDLAAGERELAAQFKNKFSDIGQRYNGWGTPRYSPYYHPLEYVAVQKPNLEQYRKSTDSGYGIWAAVEQQMKK